MSAAEVGAADSEAPRWNRAARLQCEEWWEDWRDCGEFPGKSDNAAVLCDLGAWPPAGADTSRRLFATLLYEDAARYDVASKIYVAAARADVAGVESARLTRSYNTMCRDSFGKGALDLIRAASSDEEAALQLASALRAGHEAFNTFVASIPVVPAAPAAAPAVSSDCTPSATAELPDTRSLKRIRTDGAGSSDGRGALIGSDRDGRIGTGHDLDRRVVDSAVYLRRKVFELRAVTGAPIDRPLFAVQKLLFYADAYSISKCKRRLFSKPAKALENGPVYGDARDHLNYLKDMQRSSLSAPPYGVLDRDTIGILDSVFAALGGRTTDDLIDLTHAEMPWTFTDEGELITDELMHQWFTHPAGQRVLDLIHSSVQSSAVLETGVDSVGPGRGRH